MGSNDNQDKPAGQIRLLMVFLAVPTIAFIAARGIEWKLDSTLHEALLKEFPAKAASISKISVAGLCREPDVRGDPALAGLCGLSDSMELMKLGAMAAAVTGIALLVGIKLAAKVSRRRRRLLLWLFAPGLHVTMMALSALMLLHGALAMAAIYYGESALIGRIHVGIIAALGLGALLGVLSMIRAQLSAVRKATTTALGKKIEPEEHPRTWNFVNEVASAVGADKPKAIVAGLQPNFYVTEADVVCLDGKLEGRTMYLSVPLCRIFSLSELKAVLGHELAHYKGLDTQFSRRFYPIYRGASQGLLNIASSFSEKGSASEVVLLPAFVTLSYFLNAFSEAESEISRERELAADKEGARIGGARSLATALVKLHSFSAVWLGIRAGMKKAIGEGKVLVNASALFADIVNEMDRAEAVGSVSEEGPIHPTDTHPPLSQRLKNLDITLHDVMKDSSETSPPDPAVVLFGNVEELEKMLSEVEHALMVRTGEAQLGSGQPEPETQRNTGPPQ